MQLCSCLCPLQSHNYLYPSNRFQRQWELRNIWRLAWHTTSEPLCGLCVRGFFPGAASHPHTSHSSTPYSQPTHPPTHSPPHPHAPVPKAHPEPSVLLDSSSSFNGENSHVLVLGALLSEGAAGLFLGLCFRPGGEQCLLLHSRRGVKREMGLDHSMDTPKPGAKIDPSSCWSWLPQMFRKSNRKPVDTMPREKS